MHYTIVAEEKSRRIILIVAADDNKLSLLNKKNIEILDKYHWPEHDIVFARAHNTAELRNLNYGYSGWEEITVESL